MWHLQDSDERASAFIAGPAPARWGPVDLGYSPLPPLQVRARARSYSCVAAGRLRGGWGGCP